MTPSKLTTPEELHELEKLLEAYHSTCREGKSHSLMAERFRDASVAVWDNATALLETAKQFHRLSSADYFLANGFELLAMGDVTAASACFDQYRDARGWKDPTNA